MKQGEFNKYTPSTTIIFFWLYLPSKLPLSTAKAVQIDIAGDFFSVKQQPITSIFIMWLYIVVLVVSWLVLRFFNNNIQRRKHQSIVIELCANCGKEGSNMNTCNKCKAVKYCNASCKKKHRSKHKKQCERIVAEIHDEAFFREPLPQYGVRAAELHDEALFREPPPQHGDCPICFLRLPSMDGGRTYMTCCGKRICGGCCRADVYDNHGNIIVEEKCPFCRAPVPTSNEEHIERLKKRMEVGDTYEFLMMGNAYSRGLYGLPQDRAKAIEFWHKAGKFGYTNIGNAYSNGGIGVGRDEKMARHYYELSAMDGNVSARYNLGISEENAGNFDRALKHYMIAVRGGDTDSVKEIQDMYMNGLATKDHYANALRSHQAYLVEIKSDQRDKAAALGDGYRYY